MGAGWPHDVAPVSLAHRSSASLDEAASGGATIGGIGSLPGDAEHAAGIAAFGPGSA